MADTKREEVHRGIIIPTNWDDSSAVSEVSILTVSEDVYRIVPQGPGHELFGCLRQAVEARGVVQVDNAGKKEIQVTSYRLFGDSVDWAKQDISE